MVARTADGLRLVSYRLRLASTLTCDTRSEASPRPHPAAVDIS